MSAMVPFGWDTRRTPKRFWKRAQSFTIRCFIDSTSASRRSIFPSRSLPFAVSSLIFDLLQHPFRVAEQKPYSHMCHLRFFFCCFQSFKLCKHSLPENRHQIIFGLEDEGLRSLRRSDVQKKSIRTDD